MLEKTLESPLDCKEFKPVNPKGNQSWIFIGRTDAKAEVQFFGKELTHSGMRLKAGAEGNDRGWNGWMTSQTRWTYVWAFSSSWWWTGKLLCCSPCSHKVSNTTEKLNWTDAYIHTRICIQSYVSIFWVEVFRYKLYTVGHEYRVDS